MLEDAPRPRGGPNPAVNRFSNPTAAEAIVSAMRRDPGSHQTRIADFYFSALDYLGDDRIQPVVEKLKRSQNKK
jgi:hypothetical protein